MMNDNYIFHLMKEASLVGILIVILYNILPISHYDANVKHFIVGFVGHLLFEVFGINDLYCKNGIACKRLIT